MNNQEKAESLEIEEESILRGIRKYSKEELDMHRKYYTIEERKTLLECQDYIRGNSHYLPSSLSQSQRAFMLGDKKDPVIEKRRNHRITRIMQRVYAKELESILRGESPEYPEFKTINITKEAHGKANLIAKRMVHASNTEDEVYMLALDNKTEEDKTRERYYSRIRQGKLQQPLQIHSQGSSREKTSDLDPPSYKEGSRAIMINDFYIPYQTVQPWFCAVNGENSLEDAKNIDLMDKKVVGWAHSHANMKVYHSKVDERNLQMVPDQYGTKRIITLNSFLTPYKVEVKVAPSIVFNAKGDSPDLRIVSEYRIFGSKDGAIKPLRKIFGIEKNERNNNIELKILQENNNIQSDEGEIDRSIWQRVKPYAEFKKLFAKKMGELFSHSSVAGRSELADGADRHPEENPTKKMENKTLGEKPYQFTVGERAELYKQISRLEHEVASLKKISRKFRRNK